MTTRNQLQSLAIKTINLLSILDKDDVSVQMWKFKDGWNLDVVIFKDINRYYSFYEHSTVRDNISLFRKLKRELKNDT